MRAAGAAKSKPPPSSSRNAAPRRAVFSVKTPLGKEDLQMVI